MKQKLEEGIHLVVDRYAFSGVAFTSAKPVSGSIFQLHLIYTYDVPFSVSVSMFQKTFVKI